MYPIDLCRQEKYLDTSHFGLRYLNENLFKHITYILMQKCIANNIFQVLSKDNPGLFEPLKGVKEKLNVCHKETVSIGINSIHPSPLNDKWNTNEMKSTYFMLCYVLVKYKFPIHSRLRIIPLISNAFNRN